MKQMTAKQYYFSVLAPEEEGKSYQARQALNAGMSTYLKNKAGLTPNKLKGWLNWRPVYSNDILLQRLMKELISIHCDPAREMLASTFVAKRSSKIANAGALVRDKEFSGDLVFFYVGLSDAAFQYATLYQEFAHVIRAVRNKDYNAPKHFAQRAGTLASAQRRWNKEGYIQLTTEDLLKPDAENESEATNIATTTDRFILAHELAHHYLGHTRASANPLFGLTTLDRPRSAGWKSFPSSWQYELDADSAAIGIVLGADKHLAGDRFATAAVGAALTVTVLGQMVDDVESGSDTHPPVRLRQENIMATLRSIPGVRGGMLDAIAADMRNFQRVLYRQQGQGLGNMMPDEAIAS